MAKQRTQDLYTSLYLFFASDLGGVESSTIDFTERYPKGAWTTRVETGCGIFLHRPPLHAEPVYRRSPINAVQFANTGGDGVFYSFLAPDGEWSDDSPVLVTFPASPLNDRPSYVVGKSLRDFLRLGRHLGYFSLGDHAVASLRGDRIATRLLESGRDAEWIDPDQSRQLGALAKRFRLSLMKDVRRQLLKWQKQFLPLVKYEGD